MSLTLEPILRSGGIDPHGALVIRYAYVKEHEETGLPGIHADSTDEEILAYTRRQSSPDFPAARPAIWVVFVREGGDRARQWKAATDPFVQAMNELAAAVRLLANIPALCDRMTPDDTAALRENVEGLQTLVRQFTEKVNGCPGRDRHRYRRAPWRGSTPEVHRKEEPREIFALVGERLGLGLQARTKQGMAREIVESVGGLALVLRVAGRNSHPRRAVSSLRRGEGLHRLNPDVPPHGCAVAAGRPLRERRPQSPQATHAPRT